MMKTIVSIATLLLSMSAHAGSYPIVGTGQAACYDTAGLMISCGQRASALFGQDADYSSRQPSYRDNGDGTVSDLNTGLMWQKTPGPKLSYSQAAAAASGMTLAGYRDWRLPTIRELYSLMHFGGNTGFSAGDSTPYIDASVFDFRYGDTSKGERFIDAQFATSTIYTGTTMGGNPTMFGVNFADGRIKGYPADIGTGGPSKTFFVLYVRGEAYGHNQFVDNGDGTVSDQATGLMWLQGDSGTLQAGSRGDGTLNWSEALNWAEGLDAAGRQDWRLPTAKELQSIVDYSRSPQATASAAIDPLFTVTPIIDGNGKADYPYYWTGTSHVEGGRGRNAVYFAFGEAQGYMALAGNSQVSLMDVHGAGAQRSDPKVGDPAAYPQGHGPQGDVIRIYNRVRPVRTLATAGTPSATTGPSIRGSASGPLSARILTGEIVAGSDAGKTSRVFVGASIPTAHDLFLLTPQGWQAIDRTRPDSQALWQGSLSDRHIPIFDGSADLRPHAGGAIYLGYGESFQAMLDLGRYQRIDTLQP